jgi:hypothetical protein
LDHVEFTVSGSATANITLTGSDADVMARISTFLDYNDDVIDFIGTDTVGANISSGGLTTNASGFVTSFGAGASSTLAEKIATVRAALRHSAPSSAPQQPHMPSLQRATRNPPPQPFAFWQ